VTGDFLQYGRSMMSEYGVVKGKRYLCLLRLNTFLFGTSSIAIETASTLQLSYTLLLHLN
jgi:hypothetical protein